MTSSRRELDPLGDDDVLGELVERLDGAQVDVNFGDAIGEAGSS